jgi:branched-chain amino acid transport system permease protein
MIGIYATFAAGMNLISGYSGIMSFGQAVFLGIGAYAGALLYQAVGLPLIVVFLLVIVLCGLMGAIIGLLTLRLRAVYFSITMIGVAGIFKVIATNWDSLTNGPRGLVVKEFQIGKLFSGVDYSMRIYFLTLIVLVVCLYVTNQLMKSFAGRSLIALRDGENLAMSIGVKTRSQKIYAFVLSAMVSGAAGILFAFNYKIVVPDLMGTNYTIIGLLILIIGGKGKLYAPIVGAVLYTSFYEVLRTLGEIRLVIYAALLLILIVIMPQGIIGKASEIWEKVKSNKEAKGGQVGA